MFMSIHQCQRVLDHMIDHGSITPAIANIYGVTRLAARIQDLEAQGTLINNEIKRDDTGKRYSYYTLRWPTCEIARRRLGMGWRL